MTLTEAKEHVARLLNSENVLNARIVRIALELDTAASLFDPDDTGWDVEVTMR